MQVKAVIFDLDGVICHTDKYHYRAWKALADRLGIPFDETINQRLRGVSRMESLQILLENSTNAFSQEQLASFAEEKNRMYQDSLRQLSEADLAPIVKTTLLTLREADLLLAIGSSSRNAQLILSRLGLGTFFDAVADGTQIKHSKPHPEVFLLAASLLGVAPQEALVVEDAVSGIQAAKNGGFKTAGILEASKLSETDYPIEKISDILTILKVMK